MLVWSFDAMENIKIWHFIVFVFAVLESYSMLFCTGRNDKFVLFYLFFISKCSCFLAWLYVVRAFHLMAFLLYAVVMGIFIAAHINRNVKPSLSSGFLLVAGMNSAAQHVFISSLLGDIKTMCLLRTSL